MKSDYKERKKLCKLIKFVDPILPETILINDIEIRKIPNLVHIKYFIPKEKTIYSNKGLYRYFKEKNKLNDLILEIQKFAIEFI